MTNAKRCSNIDKKTDFLRLNIAKAISAGYKALVDQEIVLEKGVVTGKTLNIITINHFKVVDIVDNKKTTNASLQK